jgi:hypothetical protein
VRALGIAGALAWSVFLISAGHLVTATSITPVRHLATGRCTVFLRAGTPAQRDRVREFLARDEPIRMIMGNTWWEELHPLVGGREMARDGAYVLVAGGR